jgi:hypothetical protein
LKTGVNSIVKFTSSCAEIRTCDDMEINENTSFNPELKSVVLYVNGALKVDKSSVVNASAYSNDEIKVQGNSNNPVYMKGMFIGQKVESHYTYWNWNTSCGSCSGNNKTDLPQTKIADETGLFTPESLMINAYPNPNNGKFKLELSSPDKGELKVKIYDYTGKEIYTGGNLDFNGNMFLPIDIDHAASGYYLLRIELNGQTYSKNITVDPR